MKPGEAPTNYSDEEDEGSQQESDAKSKDDWPFKNKIKNILINLKHLSHIDFKTVDIISTCQLSFFKAKGYLVNVWKIINICIYLYIIYTFESGILNMKTCFVYHNNVDSFNT